MWSVRAERALAVAREIGNVAAFILFLVFLSNPRYCFSAVGKKAAWVKTSSLELI